MQDSQKIVANAYDIEFPDNVGISSIFNVEDQYPYRRGEEGESGDQKEVQWEEKLPTTEKAQMEKIIEHRDGKKTRRKTYHEYLVKWKDHPMEDASWVTEPNILKHGKTVKEITDRSP
jgi:hypothetical protein